MPARTPAPGGGSVAAVAASLAAGLTAMAARFAPEDWERRAEVVGRAEELRARLEPLADADAEAYGAFMADRSAATLESDCRDPARDRGARRRGRRAGGARRRGGKPERARRRGGRRRPRRGGGIDLRAARRDQRERRPASRGDAGARRCSGRRSAAGELRRPLTSVRDGSEGQSLDVCSGRVGDSPWAVSNRRCGRGVR